MTEPEDADCGEVPVDLIELYEALEFEAMCAGFAHLNELRDVLEFEGKL